MQYRDSLKQMYCLNNEERDKVKPSSSAPTLPSQVADSASVHLSGASSWARRLSQSSTTLLPLPCTPPPFQQHTHIHSLPASHSALQSVSPLLFNQLPVCASTRLSISRSLLLLLPPQQTGTLTRIHTPKPPHHRMLTRNTIECRAPSGSHY